MGIKLTSHNLHITRHSTLVITYSALGLVLILLGYLASTKSSDFDSENNHTSISETVKTTSSGSQTFQISVSADNSATVKSATIFEPVGFKMIIPLLSHEVTVSQCYSENHEAIDFTAQRYPDIAAAASGTVTFAGCQSGDCPPDGVVTGGSGLARAVKISHEDGYTTVYGHLNEIYVKEGDIVEQGDHIGQMGASGEVIGGAHLHFMLIQGDSSEDTVDPTTFFTIPICSETSERVLKFQ